MIMAEDAEKERLVGKIFDANSAALGLIKRSEESLRDIMEMKMETSVEEIVKRNAHFKLARQLQDLTQDLRKMERTHLEKLREYQGEEEKEEEPA